MFPATHVYEVYEDKAGNDWLLTDNGLGMIPPGEKTPVSYFVDTKGKTGGMNQAFYAVQERDEDICFTSDKGRVWRYQKSNGEFHLLEIPTKANITAIYAEQEEAVMATDTDGFFTYDMKTGESVHYSHVTCKDLPDKPILSMYVDHASEIWFEQEELGVVVHFNLATGVVKREQMKVEYSNADRSRPAFHIHEDVNGYLWVHPYAVSLISTANGTASFLFMMIWAAITGVSLIRFILLSRTNRVICGFVPIQRDWKKSLSAMSLSPC